MKRMKKLLSLLIAIILIGGTLGSALAANSGISIEGSVPTVEERKAIAEKIPDWYTMPYFVGIDLTNQIVTVYRTEDASIERQMMCSSGLYNSTPIGEFFMSQGRRRSERQEWYYFIDLNVYSKWACSIVGTVMFHALTYSAKRDSAITKRSVREFGNPGSHGCIRLREEDAKWVSENIWPETFIKIYKSGVRDEDLRDILRVASYTGQGGVTYEEFMGMPANDDELGKTSTGPRVANLQARLKDIGYYDGEVTSSYNIGTMTAVKKVQSDLGMTETGIATTQLMDVLLSDNAPLSTAVTLAEGSSGPLVKMLQQALSDLGIYEGDIDSVYDVDVTEAVKRFQSACFYDADGVATSEIQQAIYTQANRLKERFKGLTYKMTVETDDMITGTISAKTKIILRSAPDTDSKALDKLSDGDTVLVRDVGDEWSKVMYAGQEGYVKTSFLSNPQTQQIVILRYTGSNGDEYTIGHTLDEYLAGARTFASEFSESAASLSETNAYNKAAKYVTVDTGDDEIKLNMRASADDDSEIVEKVPNGTKLRVISEEGEWTFAGYARSFGYMKTQYLKPVEEKKEEEDAGDDAADLADAEGETYTAIVTCGMESEDEAYVYDAGSDDANRLGSLPKGTEVEIVEYTEGEPWVLIAKEGHQGYMLDGDLRFQSGAE